MIVSINSLLLLYETQSNRFFFGVIQEWAANNETRAQIEDTVLYGYYSKYNFLASASEKKKLPFDT